VTKMFFWAALFADTKQEAYVMIPNSGQN